MKKILIFCAVIFASHAIAKSTTDLIEEALLYDQKSGYEYKLSTFDYGVKLLIKEGIIRKKPAFRADYEFYYLPTKPVNFLDAELIAYVHESFNNDGGGFGCCPDDGYSLVLLPIKDISNIKIYAKQNNCIANEAYLAEDISSKLFKELNKENLKKLIVLSCKHSDFRKITESIKSN